MKITKKGLYVGRATNHSDESRHIEIAENPISFNRVSGFDYPENGGMRMYNWLKSFGRMLRIGEVRRLKPFSYYKDKK